MTVPLPVRYLVVEWTTSVAPISIGRTRYGVAVVLSMISGMPAASAMSATARTSMIQPPGLAMASPKTARVSSSMAALTASRSSKSTKVHDQPKRLIVWLNCVIVPP